MYNLIIGAVYIPPNSTIETYQRHCNSVTQLAQAHPNHRLAIFGDFNLRSTKWSNDPLVYDFTSYASPLLRDCVSTVCNTYFLAELSQLYPLHDKKGYTLDLLFSSAQFVHQVELHDHLVSTDKHHLPALFEVDCSITDKFDASCSKLDFMNTDFNRLNVMLSACKWDELLSNDDINSSVTNFYSVVRDAISECVPLKSVRNCSYPAWYGSELIILICDKKTAHCKWKVSKLMSDYIEFKRLRSVCIRKSRECYNSYISSVENSLFRNIKYFWSFIKKSSQSEGIPSSISWEDRLATSGKDISNLFGEYFSSVYRKPSCTNLYLDLSANSIITDLVISVDDIRTAINNIRFDKLQP